MTASTGLGLLTWRCSLSLTLLTSFKRRQGRSTAGLSIGGRPHGSLMVVCAAYRGDITLDGSFQNLFPACRNDTIEIMAVDRIKLKRLQRNGNSSNLFRGERDQIRIAAHEAEEFSVCRHRRDVRQAQYPSAAGALGPMQYGAAWKMPPQRISVTSGRSFRVSPFHNWMDGSGRIIQRWSSA
jgi:hypothetical protein